MSFAEIVDAFIHRPTVSDATVWLPDPKVADADAGYFQVRLSQMFLTDGRRWSKEIIPAALLVAEYKYGQAVISQPFFISNALVKGLEPVGGNKIKIRFSDTLVFGPAPYVGGDVSLFVGLFQAAIADKRKELFSVFETIFGVFDIGGMTSYLKLADKLTATAMSFLFGGDIECLLAERRPIIKNGLVGNGHLVFLRAQKNKKLSTEDLKVQDGHLFRVVEGKPVPVEDHDFCMVRVERMAQRDDVMTMNFHSTWADARKKMLNGQVQEAQAMMLVCSNQILDSADLTEDHKISLLQFYQAKLMAFHRPPVIDEADDATRDGGSALIAEMGARAGRSAVPHADKLRKHLVSIARLTTALSAPGSADGDDDTGLKVELNAYLSKQPAPGRPSATELVRALANGSVIAPEPEPEPK